MRRDGVEPAGVELMTGVAKQEFLARHAARLGEPQQLALGQRERALLLLELADEIGDPIGAQPQLRGLAAELRDKLRAAAPGGT